jgi:sugar phosphate isomerase/epimerase
MKTSAGLFLTDILPRKRGLIHKLIKNNIFRKGIPRSQVFETLKRSGVDGIELFLPFYKKIKYDDIRDLIKVLNEHKMPVLSVHQALRFLTQTKLAEITNLFTIADMLKAKVIVLHMSSIGKQCFDKEYIETIHSLQEKFCIKVGFENREKFLGSVFSTHGWDENKFSSLMKKDNFHITLDTTHLATTGGDIIKFYKQNKNRIINIHLSDYKKNIFNSTLRPLRFKHLPLGKGNLPINEFIHTLHKEQYQGLVTMEMHTDLDGMCEGAKTIKELARDRLS